MKKIFLLLIIAVCITHESISQSFAINTDGSTANNSALLDVKSTTKGLLIPRMSKTERNLIVSPAIGLLIFQNAPDSAGFYYYDGSKWNWMAALNGNADTLAWKRNGNAGINSLNHFIGTTDNQPLRFRINNQWAGEIDSTKRTLLLGLSAGQSLLNFASGAIALGNASLKKATFSDGTISIGDSALFNSTFAIGSIAIGSKAMYKSTSTAYSIAIGDSTLYNNLSSYNTAMGYGAALKNTFGLYNSAYGYRTLYRNTTGQENTAIGHVAGYNNTTSFWQVAIGDSALYSNTGSAHNGNTAIGAHAGAYNPSASGCIYIGFRSGFTSNGGIGNIFMGSYSGEKSAGAYNIGIGQQALRNSTGNFNVALGSGAMQTSISGSSNTAIGDGAMAQDTSGIENTVIGKSALYFSRNSSANTVSGYQAMLNHKAGNNNTANGYNALYSDTSGAQNVAVGYYAMRNYHGNNNTSLGTNSLDFLGMGNNNTAIGYDADVMKTNLSNATAIGAFSRIDTSNAMVLGNTNINVGIGITKPYQAKLTVSANTAAAGSTLAIFGYDQAGLSFQQNDPTIGYNQYRDISAGNAPRYMGNGFAWINHMEPTTGNMYWNSMPSGTANAAGGLETLRMTLTNTGSLGLNTIPTGNGQLQFPNVLDNRKIVMWESINNGIDFFGFGINGATLRYQVPLGNVHRFFAGNSILYTIFDNGNATLAGTLTQLSDERLKQNIKLINSTLSDLKKLNAYTYYWKDESRDQDMQIGLLAQEVEKVFPQLVKKDEAGLLGVNYNGFAPLLIKGMQEQQRMIEDLKKQIDELRQLIKK